MGLNEIFTVMATALRSPLLGLAILISFAGIYLFSPDVMDHRVLVIGLWISAGHVLAAIITSSLRWLKRWRRQQKISRRLRGETKQDREMTWRSLSHLSQAESEFLLEVFEKADETGLVRNFWKQLRIKRDNEVQILVDRRIIARSRRTNLGGHFLSYLDDEWWQIDPLVWARKKAALKLIKNV